MPTTRAWSAVDRPAGEHEFYRTPNGIRTGGLGTGFWTSGPGEIWGGGLSWGRFSGLEARR